MDDKSFLDRFFDLVVQLTPRPSVVSFREHKDTGAKGVRQGGILFWGVLGCKYYFGRQAMHISFEADLVADPAAYGLRYTSTKDGWIRFHIQTLEDIALLKDLLYVATAEKESLATVETFGCCDRFAECSDARECLRFDEAHWGCMYRKNLEQGKIFYGKNANQ